MKNKEVEKTLIDCAMSLGDEVWGLCSGGKDSMASCYIAHKYGKLDVILTIDTTVPAMYFDEKTGDLVKPAIEAAKKFSDRLGIPHVVVRTKENAYKEWVKKYGMPHPSQHNMIFREIKWKAMRQFVMSKKKLRESGTVKRLSVCFISGVRKLESHKRLGSAKPIQVDPSCSRMRFVAPIIYWSDQETIDFNREQGFELSTCYNTIQMSGDCLCGAYAKKGESFIIKKFYPASAELLEECERVANKNHSGKIKGWGKGEGFDIIEDMVCADCRTDRKNGE